MSQLQGNSSPIGSQSGLCVGELVADSTGEPQSADAVFALCKCFADTKLVDKAQAAYTAIQSGAFVSDFSFNMV